MVYDMIPILFASTTADFNTNGIGRLAESTYCTVTEERNGVFELEMQLPITAKHFDSITEESVIVAQPRPGADGQPFRVYSISKPMNGVVTVYARHISYELNKIIAMPFTASSCAGAFAMFAAQAATACPFTFWTDKVVTANFRLQQPTAMRSVLGGTAGSFLDVFGTGEYEFDGYDVKLHQNRGSDRGVTIRYGKNLTDLNDTTDTTNVYTGIVPFYKSDLATVVLPEKVLWGEHRNDYPYGMVKAVDLTSQFENPPTVAQLRTAGTAYLSRSTGWQIANNLKISFVNLADTEEYKNIAVLERVNLCDTVTVVHPVVGVEATAKVVKAEYDVLQERYKSLELGAARTNLGQAITDTILDEVPTTSMMQDAIDHANAMITGGLGGYIQYEFNANGQPIEMLILNKLDKAQATSVWRWNLGGLGHGSSYDTPASDIALTADGKINASMITTGQLNANIIKTGVIKGVQGSMQIDVDAGTITLGNKALRITAGNFQLDSNGNVTITGTITAASGSKLGAWTVSNAAIWRTHDTYNTAGGMYFGTSGLSLSDKFRVSSAGAMTASNVNITGGGINIDDKFVVSNAGKMTAKDVSITGGGININSGQFVVASDGTVTAKKINITGGSLSIRSSATKLFQVDQYGKVTAKDVDISGKLSSTSGSIGGWNINSTAIYRNNQNFGNASGMYFGTNGLSITNVFKVDNLGNATVGGKLTAKDGSKIGAWNVSNNAIYLNNSAYGVAGGLYFGTSGISLSNKFKVDNTGKLTASDVNITGGGINIGNSKFKVESTGTLTATGATVGGTINASGGTFSGTITCTGTISGGTISGGKIQQTVSSTCPVGGYSPSTRGTQASIEGGVMKCGAVQINGGESLLAEGSDSNGWKGIQCTGHFSSVGTVWIGGTYSNDREMLDVRGTVWGRYFQSLNGYETTSDRRKKQDITDLPTEKAVGFIMSLNPVSFRYRENPARKWHGFIAQDVEQIAYDDWDIVSDYTDARTGEVSKTMSYQDITADLVATVQAQARRIYELEARLARLESLLDGDMK